jgi:electron transfer flavoprotein beta subunit
MGADRAVLLSDRAFAGSDTLATAYAIAGAVEKLGEFDLILCGQQAIDGDTAQVGPMLAENLHIPQITYVNRIEIDKRHVVGTREVEAGYERVRCRTPVLITVVKGINVPRVPTYSDLSDAMDKDIEVWSARDLALEERFLGLGGSPTAVTRVWAPESRAAGQLLTGDPAELAAKLADILMEAVGIEQ